MMSLNTASPPELLPRMALLQNPPFDRSLCQCLPACPLSVRPAMASKLKGLRVSPLLRVLMLVDTVPESDMLAHELRRTGFELAVRRATTEAAYLAELESPLDLILADNALLEFDSMRALQI